MDEAWDDTRREPLLRSPWPALVVAVAALLLAGASLWRQQAAADAARVADLHAQEVQHELATLQASADRTNARVRSTEAAVRARSTSVAPLAARTLKSVFTVDAGAKIGTAFLGWTNADGSYLLTANHVVEGSSGPVRLTRKGGGWSAEVVAQDRVNDLALLRAEGHPANARPLWQNASRRLPRTGEQLLLIGSPYGLGGTVTTGIVSRVTRKEIQTDAAANPGNSGGPAIDRGGHVVGILVAGGGENINFAIRIERACAKLRRCTG